MVSLRGRPWGSGLRTHTLDALAFQIDTTKATFGDCEVALKNGVAHLAMLEGRTISGSSLERGPVTGWLLDGFVHVRPISDTGLVRGLFLDFLRSSASLTSHGVLHKEEQQLVMGVVAPNAECLQQVRREDLLGSSLRLHECAQLQCLESDVINVLFWDYESCFGAQGC
eukprot:SM000906S24558  [mRNA]  locus=s906:496:2071:- [translate_table: standard]